MPVTNSPIYTLRSNRFSSLPHKIANIPYSDVHRGFTAKYHKTIYVSGHPCYNFSPHRHVRKVLCGKVFLQFVRDIGNFCVLLNFVLFEHFLEFFLLGRHSTMFKDAAEREIT